MREKDKPDYDSTAYKSRDGVQEMARVLYYDLWGRREDKYKFLESASLDNVNWIEVKPTEPNYFFAPKNLDYEDEYKLNVSKDRNGDKNDTYELKNFIRKYKLDNIFNNKLITII